MTTPHLFMYLHRETVEDVQNAWSKWTERLDDNNFGNSQSPVVAALDENGSIEFENTSQLVPGNYRLTVLSGNIGRTDSDFDGFAVEISIDTLILARRLLRGKSGNNITGTDVFDFSFEGKTSGNWILGFNWSNAFRNTKKSVARQLAIYRYKLEKLASTPYEVSIDLAGTTPMITELPTYPYSGTVPGGWLAELSSYGSVFDYRHESQAYSQNDTLANNYPLANTLTAQTGCRREDIIINGSDVVLTNPSGFTLSSSGSVWGYTL